MKAGFDRPAGKLSNGGPLPCRGCSPVPRAARHRSLRQQTSRPLGQAHHAHSAEWMTGATRTNVESSRKRAGAALTAPPLAPGG